MNLVIIGLMESIYCQQHDLRKISRYQAKP
nr:MAG TPA: hypothetical protein [Caudoviricetes sp.]